MGLSNFKLNFSAGKRNPLTQQRVLYIGKYNCSRETVQHVIVLESNMS